MPSPLGKKGVIPVETNKYKHFLLFFIMGVFMVTKSAQAASIYDFRVKTIDGQEKSLSDYKGKALVIVNTASHCGFTPQYKDLEDLYEKFKAKGFEILGFPANNFANQEPGGDEEIKKFCTLRFNVKFPLFSKISVKGKDIHPLYKYLTTESGFDGDVGWNFNKFIVSPEGKVAARFGAQENPLSKKFIAALEPLLPTS